MPRGRMRPGEADLRLILDASSEVKVHRVLDRLRRHVTPVVRSIEKHPEGGFEVRAGVAVPDDEWARQVLFVLAFAQRFGRGWGLSGNILEGVEMSATDFTVSGITFALLHFDRPDLQNFD